MLIYNQSTGEYVIDPHYLSIIVFKRIWDNDEHPEKEIAQAKLMWIYHMYNPHSPFRDYRQSEKSASIVKAVFPQYYIEAREKDLQMIILEANTKNKDTDILNKEIEEQMEFDKKSKNFDPHDKMYQLRPKIFVPTLRIYNPGEDDNDMLPAIEWYKEDHLKHTPLWNAVSAYDEAMYNLADVIRNRQSTPNDIKIASTELDLIPLKREKMRQQAVKDEAQTLKVQGDKNIKRGEKLPIDRKRQPKVV